MKIIEGVRFYTVPDLQTELQVTKTTILKYLTTGMIKGVKIGNSWHISEIALREFLGLPTK